MVSTSRRFCQITARGPRLVNDILRKITVFSVSKIENYAAGETNGIGSLNYIIRDPERGKIYVYFCDAVIKTRARVTILSDRYKSTPARATLFRLRAVCIIALGSPTNMLLCIGTGFFNFQVYNVYNVLAVLLNLITETRHVLLAAFRFVVFVLCMSLRCCPGNL